MAAVAFALEPLVSQRGRNRVALAFESCGFAALKDPGSGAPSDAALVRASVTRVEGARCARDRAQLRCDDARATQDHVSFDE